MMWVRLADSKALPFPNLGATSADFKGSMFLLTPEAGVRLLDKAAFRLDRLAGLRYWHMGQSLKLDSDVAGVNASAAQNLVDPLVGVRIESACHANW